MAPEQPAWPKTAQEIGTRLIAAMVSSVVLLIFASDRLDGDELWKGAMAGPATIGACQFFRSAAAQQILAKLFGRWLG